MALIAPLLCLTIAAFVLPIGSVLFQAIDDREVGTIMPRTTTALAEWDGQILPPDAAFAAALADIGEAYRVRTVHRAAERLNHELPGSRSLLMRTARAAARLDPHQARTALTGLDPRWGELDTWRTIKSSAGPFTARYLLAALDLDQEWDGSIARTSKDRRIYLAFLERTVTIAFSVTMICALLGFPLAHVLAHARAGLQRLLFYLVLLPFWTSLLVRTAAWVVLLQREGVVNGALLATGLVQEPVPLIYNRFGVLVAMTHILLPFMVLPLYSVMRAIPREQMRAAGSLGASPFAAFLTVYLPQALPGLGAGCLLVMVLAAGFYITPVLVGGAGDQLLSTMIAQFALGSANWSMAAALAIVLVACVLLVLPLYARVVGLDRVRVA